MANHAVGSARRWIQERKQAEGALSGHYAWTAAMVAVFITCDVIPLIAEIRYTVPLVLARRGQSAKWTGRIKLDLDPAISVQAVVALRHSQARIRHSN